MKKTLVLVQSQNRQVKTDLIWRLPFDSQWFIDLY